MILGCLVPTVDAGEKARSTDGALLELAGQAIVALQGRLGTDARVLRLHLGYEEVELDAQDPAEPAHVDRYTWREARLAGPEPVAAGRNLRQLKARLFALRDVRLVVLQRALSEAVRATQTEDGHVTQVVIERDDYSSDSGDGWIAPLLRVHVDGPRSGGFLQMNLDGKHRRVMRW